MPGFTNVRMGAKERLPLPVLSVYLHSGLSDTFEAAKGEKYTACPVKQIKTGFFTVSDEKARNVSARRAALWVVRFLWGDAAEHISNTALTAPAPY